MPTSTAPRAGFLLALLALVAFALRADVAGAGTYEVRACDAAGGANNSWTLESTFGMAAYVACPTQGDRRNGLVARNAVSAYGRVPYGSASRLRFEAPEGAAVVGVWHRTNGVHSTGWNVGLSNGAELLWGFYADDGQGFTYGFGGTEEYTPVPGNRVVYYEAACYAGGGCSTHPSYDGIDWLRAGLRVQSVRVVVADWTQPRVEFTGGSLLSGGWKRGVQEVSFHAEDNVGIRDARVVLDGGDVRRHGRTCDDTFPVPCPQGGDVHAVDTRATGRDGEHILTAEATDTAGNVTQVKAPVLVDNTPPGQPEDLSLDGGENWRSANDFAVRWRTPADDRTAPIAGATYELCPTTGERCTSGSRDGADLTSIAGLKVPAAGQYVMRVWLRDGAGNEDRRTASPPIRLRLDDDPPDLAFEEQDPDDPTGIEVRAFDRTSGMAGGEIEVRRRGTDTWRPLETRLTRRHLLARMDDERLPEGDYELRARGFDQAWNERSTDRRTDGAKAAVRLPLRVQTRLRAGIVKRTARKGRRRSNSRGRGQTLVRVGRVRYGRRARVAGHLTSGSDSPIGDAEVLVLERRGGELLYRPVASVRTSATGRFAYLTRPGPSRTIRFRYVGTATVRPAVDEVDLATAATSSFLPHRRVVLNGEAVTFRGRLLGRPVPTSGKLVEIQAHFRQRWRTFATARTSSRGRWRYEYRFDGTRGRQTYRLRARIPYEAAYPYATGYSRAAKVTVRGL